MIGPSRFAGAGRDALPRVRRCTSRRFFSLLLRTRSYAIGAEALSLSCFSMCTFFGRATPDRAGARPYQPQHGRLVEVAVSPARTVTVPVVVPGVSTPRDVILQPRSGGRMMNLGGLRPPLGVDGDRRGRGSGGRSSRAAGVFPLGGVGTASGIEAGAARHRRPHVVLDYLLIAARPLLSLRTSLSV